MIAWFNVTFTPKLQYVKEFMYKICVENKLDCCKCLHKHFSSYNRPERRKKLTSGKMERYEFLLKKMFPCIIFMPVGKIFHTCIYNQLSYTNFGFKKIKICVDHNITIQYGVYASEEGGKGQNPPPPLFVQRYFQNGDLNSLQLFSLRFNLPPTLMRCYS